jgi:SAM-dependent methyltransferase
MDQAQRTEDVEAAWHLTAALITQERPDARLVLDAASGPGGFLATVLDALPAARGVWFDGSSTMEDEARRRLERFGDRVEYRIGDLTDISSVVSSNEFDLVTSSRATHHLLVTDLAAFYRQAAGLLAPGGWIANLDSLNPTDPWRSRLRGVRGRLRAERAVADVSTHVQLHPAPLEGDHVAAIRAAGFVDTAIIWRSFVTGLVVAQKPPVAN